MIVLKSFLYISCKRMFVKSKLILNLAIKNRVYTDKICLRRLEILGFSLVHAVTERLEIASTQTKSAYAGWKFLVFH
jgi:hypothetical protein